jgi:hypothetical protein
MWCVGPRHACARVWVSACIGAAVLACDEVADVVALLDVVCGAKTRLCTCMGAVVSAKD